MPENLPTVSPAQLPPKLSWNRILLPLLALVVIIISVLGSFLLLRGILPETKPEPQPQSIASLPPIESAEDAQERLSMIASRLTNPEVAKIYQEKIREAATFNNPNRPAGIVELERAGKYHDIYSQFVAQFYATQDREVLALAQQLRAFIQKKYPATYLSVERSSGPGWKIEGE